MRPALTPEEWANNFEPSAMTYRHDVGDGLAHAVAARCLHGQPFGFTREDVAMIREVEGQLAGWERWVSLADRIEALLPPEDAKPLPEDAIAQSMASTREGKWL